MSRLHPVVAPDPFEVWRVDLSMPPDAEELALLSSAELARAARFAFDRDRRRYLVAHAALRQLVADRTRLAPAHLSFELGLFGKPVLALSGDCAFNLSHSGDAALIALAEATVEIGVDIELLRPVADADDLAARHYRPAEQAALRGLTAAARDRCFLQCWTRKEACLKAIGSGLQIAPDGFEAGTDAASRVVSVPTASGLLALDLHSLSLGDAWVGALACWRPGASTTSPRDVLAALSETPVL